MTALDPSAVERLRRFGGTRLLREMIELFLQNAPARVAAAEEALANDDLAAAERAWHSLKSSAGNLGVTSLQHAAASAERAAAAGDAALAGQTSPAVRAAQEAAMAALQTLLGELRDEEDRSDRG